MRTVVGHADLRQIAFVGPFGVGKTTAVRTISDTEVVNTDVVSAVGRAPRPGSPRKRSTTVGIDYGEWISPVGVVSIVGTPGQERFVTMRQSALPRSTAVVLWLFGDRGYAVDEGEEWVTFLGGRPVWERLTVAVTRHGDTADSPPLSAFRAMLDRYDRRMPLVTADPRDRGDLVELCSRALRLPVPLGSSA